MENFGIIISIIGLCFTIVATIAGGIIWGVRQEGRINLANQKIEDNKRASEKADETMADKLATAIAALAKFDENTQLQVENYQKHTEHKIDELGRNMSSKFEKVFDKLDQKADKP